MFLFIRFYAHFSSTCTSLEQLERIAYDNILNIRGQYPLPSWNWLLDRR
jgi:hypothetical protein